LKRASVVSLVILIVGLSAAPAQAAKRCKPVQTERITATNVTTFGGLNCTPARSLLKRYFRKVVATAQSPGGCAQARNIPDEGCAVRDFTCYTRFSQRTRLIYGRCTDGRRAIRFIETDRGPT
jgi:hypothetical protein